MEPSPTSPQLCSLLSAVPLIAPRISTRQSPWQRATIALIQRPRTQLASQDGQTVPRFQQPQLDHRSARRFPRLIPRCASHGRDWTVTTFLLLTKTMPMMVKMPRVVHPVSQRHHHLRNSCNHHLSLLAHRSINHRFNKYIINRRSNCSNRIRLNQCESHLHNRYTNHCRSHVTNQQVLWTAYLNARYHLRRSLCLLHL